MPDEVLPPRVGIVLRTKNRPWFLARALRDISAQTYSGWHVHIVNDGGDQADVDRLVADQRAKLQGSISVTHHQVAQGRSAAANRGVEGLDTEFVVLHDDDDLWAPEFLARTVAWLDDRPTDIGVMVRTEIVYEVARDGGFAEVGRAPFWSGMSSISYSEFMLGNRAVPISYLYRRALHDAVGAYREDLHAVEDWEFSLRTLLRFTIGFIDGAPLAFWMQRVGVGGELGNSMFALAGEHDAYDRQVRDEALRAWVLENGPGLPLFLGRLVRDEVARQLDERRSLSQRAVEILRSLRDRRRR